LVHRQRLPRLIADTEMRSVRSSLIGRALSL
jgi:hypothetical protein